jgi:hypothetical protein
VWGGDFGEWPCGGEWCSRDCVDGGFSGGGIVCGDFWDGGVNQAVLRMIFWEVGVPSSSLLCGETIGEEQVFRIISLWGHRMKVPLGSFSFSILVGTNGMITLRKILIIIRGKDGRGRTPLLQIKTVKGLKREKFLPLWCGTYLSLTVWSVCSLMLGKLNSCFVMSNEREMERSDIVLMVASGNILTWAMRRTFLTIQGILDLVLAPMEWIL